VYVGFNLRTGRIVRQDGLWSGDRVSSTSRQERKGNIKVDDRLSSGTRTWGEGRRNVKKRKNKVGPHGQRRRRVHFDVDLDS